MKDFTFRPVPLVVTLVVLIPILAIIVWPQLLGLHTQIFFAQSIAFRTLSAAVLATVAVIAIAVAVIRRRLAVAAGFAVSFGAAALTVAMISGVIGNTGTIASTSGPPRDDTVVVASWNTQGASTAARDITQLVIEEDADVVMLPETDEIVAAQAAQLLSVSGRTMTAHTTYGSGLDTEMPTSILISATLGTYRLDDTSATATGLPSGVWDAVDGIGPTLIAVHTQPPMPWSMSQWRSDLAWIPQNCTSPNTIIAGDLNATNEHLRGMTDPTTSKNGRTCVDAAASMGMRGAGTWPTFAAIGFAAPIDHVIVGAAWQVDDFEVIDTFNDRGSDHRPIVARLNKP
jgi:endonuclease/exonuclease/phosphatase (EEP) superfamily protein YafD